MPPKRRSPSSTPVPSTEGAQGDGSQLPEAEWKAMQDILSTIYNYRTADGFDPSKLFHRKVNKRVIPEYYETIKEPIALSTIKGKINSRQYQSFHEFVRDFALIPHNAQVFNRPDSGAFQDALIIKEVLERELQKRVQEGLISADVAKLPDLGEIPTYEDVPMEGADGEAAADEEEEDEEEDEDEEGEEDGSEEEVVKRKRGRPRGKASIAKRETSIKDEPDEATGTRKTRPPKMLTPMESRIQAVLKGVRKPKNQRGQLMIKHFERLPDKQAMPEYFAEIKNPMAYDLLKKKVKRKKYNSLEEFVADVNLMFNNAKQYNLDDSPIFKDADALLAETRRLYNEEKARPDSDFAMEEGKIPMPNGILHNGELYKVGDWVHVQNVNDLTKPIPCQIYRTYQDAAGAKWVNVCWYYRPEQTVHRFDKHFLTNEIVKTGRYRDHRVDEILGRCFVMFFTRYFKGRPRGLPPDMEIYVCESRYNEERHQFNKIKTWASCLPDEVRDKDYEMDLFERPRKMKKFPSPIGYTLKDDQKETDDFPKVQWGAEGAPPKIGGVHRRPRDPKDSPPPEPTPPPPPRQPTPPPRQMPAMSSANNYSATPVGQVPPRPQTVQRPSYNASHPQQYAQPSASPAPQRPISAQAAPFPPQTPQAQNMARPLPPPSTYQSSTLPPNPASYQRPTTADYRQPPPIELYTLPDQANASIPVEIRDQFQQDQQGHVLFFTAPPVQVADESKSGAARGHSVRYLAEKARREEILAQKRKDREALKAKEHHVAKKQRTSEQQDVESSLEELKRRALTELERRMAGFVARELGERDMQVLAAAQKETTEMRRLVEEHEASRSAMGSVLQGNGVFGDDGDARVT